MRAALTLFLVLLAAGCGGADESAGRDKTFENDDYSFSYPRTWVERAADNATGTADVQITPGPGFTFISVGRRGELYEAITAENLSGFADELRGAAEEYLTEYFSTGPISLDGELENLTVAELPAVGFEGEDDGVRLRAIWIFDRTTVYSVECQAATDDQEMLTPACDRVVDSLEMS